MADWITFAMVVLGQVAVAAPILIAGIWWPQAEQVRGTRPIRSRHRAVRHRNHSLWGVREHVRTGG
ncbi:hypothetical protein [Nocardia sp. SYP-A9097]|uniref:hypothetical protein n=1 Tax=Nocardia sp. SYP-A9097 TaxID=2663237 RepID=UPI00129A36BF|nr:hypothetical protein [Nocardia sp. SYP-A9097]